MTTRRTRSPARGSAPAVLAREWAPAVLARGSAPAAVTRGCAPAVLARGSASAAVTRGSAPAVLARGSAGQATVELVAMLPLAALIALAIGQFLAAGAAAELAGNAAEAGAAAILQGTDPAAAARAALPGWSRDRATVRVDGRRVEVRVRPRVVAPVLADRLEAKAIADAGPSS